jgi:hypothetical protein
MPPKKGSNTFKIAEDLGGRHALKNPAATASLNVVSETPQTPRRER